MQRVASITGLALLAATLVACGDSGSETTNDTTGASVATTDATAGMGMTDATTGGGSMTDPTMTGASDSGMGTSTSAGPMTSTTTEDMTSGTTQGVSDTDDPPPMCAPEDCEPGQYCNMGSGECEPGCDDEEDCQGETVCDLDANVCTGCVSDGDCALGTVCNGGTCEPGCNDQQPCQEGFTCCTDICVDAINDPLNCGACGNECPDPGNTVPTCTEGMCGFDCAEDYENCDGDAANGCENLGTCLCTPGDTQDCYTGLPQTEGVGECQAGTQTCNNNGTGWGPCEGEVLPLGEDICNNNADDNCDGVVDEDPDSDNDGYTVCGGDCCDAIGPNCQNPDLVNPGAFEVDGNDVDDDCDGTKDNPVPICDNNLASNTQNGDDYARAIDLCQFTTENAQGADKIWGVISGVGGLRQPSGNDGESNNGHSVRNGFGSNITNSKGQRLAVLSSGHAADNAGDNNPNFAPFETGVNTGPDQTAPADWLAANGGSFPNAPGCPISGNTNANDGQMLRLRVRVPTNANSFTVKFFFFSAEYPEYVCTSFNDFFVTLVDSNDNENPADKNIAIYAEGNNQWPVGVNLVSAAPNLFAVCDNGNIGCAGGPNVPYNGCNQGENLLTGTGFDLNAGACSGNDDVGGGTGWLIMSGNVTPGETMEIRFAIWDTGDSVWDSLVLLDHWEWSVQASEPGIQPG